MTALEIGGIIVASLVVAFGLAILFMRWYLNALVFGAAKKVLNAFWIEKKDRQ
jgi:hypothetical protein